MENEKSGDEEKSERLPPVNGVDYPEKPTGDVSAMEMMEYMERVDRYWQARGFQKLHDDEEKESTDEQE